MIRKLAKEKLWALLIGLISGCLILGCTTATNIEKVPEIIAPGENRLRVGVSPNAPPLIFKQDQTIVGLEADFAREFAEYLAKSLYFVELQWKDLIPALLDNRIDIIMSGMSITTLREMRIAFSAPYFKSGLMAMIRRNDAARFMIGYYSFTKSSAMGAVKNTTGEFFIKEQFGRIKKVLFSTSEEGVEALIDKKIDIFIHDAPIILYLASVYETNDVTPLYTLLTEEYLAWAVQKTDGKLLKSANSFIQTLEKDGKLKPMIQRWIPFIH